MKIINEPDTGRQQLIKEIQEITGRKLITYLAAFDAPAGNSIDHNDVPVFNDLLTSLNFPDELDLLIHSPGGTVEATQKLVYMLRDKVKHLRIIIPESAKSAATLLSLASDEILMPYLAELGPIDPQIPTGVDPITRQMKYRPAWSILDSVENLEKSLNEGRNPNIVGALLGQLDPLLLDVAQKALDYAGKLAEEWLHKYMGLNKKRAREITNYLLDIKREHLSHGGVINYNQAREKGLKVTKIDESSELWKKVWEYHLRATKIALRVPRTKVCDCEKHSLFHEILIQRALG